MFSEKFLNLAWAMVRCGSRGPNEVSSKSLNFDASEREVKLRRGFWRR